MFTKVCIFTLSCWSALSWADPKHDPIFQKPMQLVEPKPTKDVRRSNGSELESPSHANRSFVDEGTPVKWGLPNEWQFRLALGLNHAFYGEEGKVLEKHLQMESGLRIPLTFGFGFYWPQAHASPWRWGIALDAIWDTKASWFVIGNNSLSVDQGIVGPSLIYFGRSGDREYFVRSTVGLGTFSWRERFTFLGSEKIREQTSRIGIGGNIEYGYRIATVNGSPLLASVQVNYVQAHSALLGRISALTPSLALGAVF